MSDAWDWKEDLWRPVIKGATMGTVMAIVVVMLAVIGVKIGWLR